MVLGSAGLLVIDSATKGCLSDNKKLLICEDVFGLCKTVTRENMYSFIYLFTCMYIYIYTLYIVFAYMYICTYIDA